MDEHPNMRAADHDRQVIADRLRRAQDEGRLSLQEYDTRLTAAYRAATYRDLAVLVADLPAGQPAVPAPQAAFPARSDAPTGTAAALWATLPGAVKVLWWLWLTIVVLNLVVWGLVSMSNTAVEYFWPMWLGVPGVVLAGLSLGVVSLRHPTRRAAPPSDSNSP
ncbi:MAG: DUF1707 SHOCT-like domain-containing protein [Sciscionella sp.]